MGSACSDASGDAGDGMHSLRGLVRDSSSPRSECGYVGRRAGVFEARVSTTTGSQQRTKLHRGATSSDIIGARMALVLLRAPTARVRGKRVGVEKCSNAFGGSMSGMRT